MIRLILFAFMAVAAMAQTTHSVTLTWTDTLNPAGTTYNEYKATATCASNPTFTKIVSGLTAKTYLDTAVQTGPYCYYVTAVYNAVESVPSSKVDALVPAFAPTGISAVAQ